MPIGEVVERALAYYRSPLAYQDWLAGSAPLPEEMDQLLTLAHGASETLVEAAHQCGVPPDEVSNAARFLIQQLCFTRGADHYRVLGLAPGASLQQIKDHHRRLMWLFHPDRAANGDAWTAGYATRINDAWNTLSRPEARANYDILLQQGDPRLGAAIGSTPGLDPTPTRGKRRGPRGTARPGRRPTLSRRWLPLWVLGGCALIGVLLEGAMNVILPSAAPPLYAPTAAHLTPLPTPDRAATTAELEWVRQQHDHIAQQLQAASRRHEEPRPESPVVVRTVAPDPPPRPEPPATRSVQSAPVPTRTEPLARFSPTTDPPKQVDQPRNKPELTAWETDNLISNYTSAYQRGDLNALMALFAADARGKDGSDRGGIRRAYAAMFKSFVVRRLLFRSMRWNRSGDTASAVGRYEVSLAGRDNGQPTQLAGDLYLTVRKRDGQVLIQAIDYNWQAN